MGKRFDKKGKGKKKASRESDASLRLTYLWSAAHLLSRRAPTASAFYVGTIKQVGRRVTLPLDALTIKRFACKACNALLIPGQSARVRVAAKRERHVVVSCDKCGELRRFLARPPRDVLGAGKGSCEGGGEGGGEVGSVAPDYSPRGGAGAAEGIESGRVEGREGNGVW